MGSLFLIRDCLGNGDVEYGQGSCWAHQPIPIQSAHLPGGHAGATLHRPPSGAMKSSERPQAPYNRAAPAQDSKLDAPPLIPQNPLARRTK